MEREHATVQLDGWEIAVTLAGDGSPTLVCLHGFGTNRASWEPVLGSLAGIGRVVTVDRPGFGGTSLGDTPERRRRASTVDGEAAIVAAALRELGVVRCVLVGHSAGALVAAAVALAEADLVTALVLESPAIDGALGPPRGVRAFARTPVGRALGPAMLRVGAPVALRAGLRRSYHDQAAATAAGARMRTSTDRQGWAEDLWDRTRHWRRPDVFERLGEIPVPALVVAGSRDRVVSGSQVAAVANALPDAVSVTVDGAGHVPHEERPGEFTRAVRSFLTAW